VRRGAQTVAEERAGATEGGRDFQIRHVIAGPTLDEPLDLGLNCRVVENCHLRGRPPHRGPARGMARGDGMRKEAPERAEAAAIA